VAEHLAEDGSYFINIKPASNGLNTELYVFDLVLAHARKWGWHFATEFCWQRPGVPGEPARRFKNQYEPIYQFTKQEWKFRPQNVRYASDSVPSYSPDNHLAHVKNDLGVSQGTKGKGFVSVTEGMAYPGNRLSTFAGTHSATGHAAAFPVGLPEFFVKAYTDKGDTVYDPFMGSGSTIIAAHNQDRIGHGIELSPAYCDIICNRFQGVTGIIPILEATGEEVSFVDS